MAITLELASLGNNGANTEADTGDELHKRALAVPMQRLACGWAQQAGLALWVRRDDLIDTLQSGNKFYKLFYNVQQAKAMACSEIYSAGGAWSNHLYALAAAGWQQGIATRALVRGERSLSVSATLADAERWHMQLDFLSRQDYRAQARDPVQNPSASHSYWVPEGGANRLGALGMSVAGWAIEQQFPAAADICTAVGTGTGLAGLAAGMLPQRRVLGFSVLKGAGTLGRDVARLYSACCAPGSAARWGLISGFHGGGYGRRPDGKLLAFWRAFEEESGLLLDPVYTLKLFWGIYQLAQQGYWPRGATVIAIHTGGLQGRRGFACPG